MSTTFAAVQAKLATHLNTTTSALRLLGNVTVAKSGGGTTTTTTMTIEHVETTQRSMQVWMRDG